MTAPFGVRPCPCGSGTPYDACCGPLHRGASLAATAEQLMRSRFSAFAVGDVDHLFRTWHPRTRPDAQDLAPDPRIEWTRLEVLDAVEHGDRAEVEFEAHHRVGGVPAVLHERSRFERRAGRWFYVDGDLS